MKSVQNSTLSSIGGCNSSDLEISCGNDTSSRSSSSGGVERDLEPYAFEEATSAMANLDLSKAGWSVEDMLIINETKYGYKSTFNADMSEYTMPVRRENTAEFRRREAEAERLAREIESDYNYTLNVDKELSDGEDEELAFSAVHRGGENDAQCHRQRNAKPRSANSNQGYKSNKNARHNNQRKSNNSSNDQNSNKGRRTVKNK
jgi:hypothetical protein